MTSGSKGSTRNGEVSDNGASMARLDHNLKSQTLYRKSPAAAVLLWRTAVLHSSTEAGSVLMPQVQVPQVQCCSEAQPGSSPPRCVCVWGGSGPTALPITPPGCSAIVLFCSFIVRGRAHARSRPDLPDRCPPFSAALPGKRFGRLLSPLVGFYLRNLRRLPPPGCFQCQRNVPPKRTHRGAGVVTY